MKPFTNALLAPQQQYFNYRLSSQRMVTEGAYGQLKERWRIFLKKCDSRPEEVRLASLACIVLHNVCFDRGDTILQKLDLTRVPSTGELRNRTTIRRFLQMRNCSKIRDTSPQANCIRERYGVCQMFLADVKLFRTGEPYNCSTMIVNYVWKLKSLFCSS